MPRTLFSSEIPVTKDIRINKIIKEKKIIVNVPIMLKGQQYYVYMEKEVELYEDFLDNMFPIIYISIFIVIMFSLFEGMFISKKFVNKLKHLKNTMENVKEKGVSSRVEIFNDKDEIGNIGIVFNSMMDEVEKSFNSQKQFVQDASHELRTPLTILKGHLQMLNRWGKDDPDTLNKSLKITLDEIERLIKIVNDLLSLSNADSKVKKEDITDIEINQTIEEVIYGFNVLKQGINFDFQKQNSIYFRILGEHLKQIIIILIDNSIKYCDKDEKNIEIKSYEDDKNVYVSVRDNGIGIREEDIGKVTNKFYRVDKSRKYDNSFGIGLSIASKLVKLYGGDLKISSEFGIYTEVLISFKK